MATLHRPYFGRRQVRTPAGIKPRNVLVEVAGDKQDRDVIIVLSEPYLVPDAEDPIEDLVFDYVYKGSPTEKSYGYLCDFGVVPYKYGWNPSNHLLRTGRRRLTPEEVEAIRSRIRV